MHQCSLNGQWDILILNGDGQEQVQLNLKLKEVIGTYRSKNIPIDNFCFDFDWKYWGVPEMDNGEFTWNGDNFPSAASGNLKNGKMIMEYILQVL